MKKTVLMIVQKLETILMENSTYIRLKKPIIQNRANVQRKLQLQFNNISYKPDFNIEWTTVMSLKEIIECWNI
eukprot:GAHX01005195.1.p1 GENE.GAHX01005195.1~~GAHX01005195.1.p1  ORF type:complete len:73 (-),score=5.02 GAHX01005195.1:63-281(-)